MSELSRAWWNLALTSLRLLSSQDFRTSDDGQGEEENQSSAEGLRVLRADLSADFVAQDAVPGLLDEWLIPPHARGWT